MRTNSGDVEDDPSRGDTKENPSSGDAEKDPTRLIISCC